MIIIEYELYHAYEKFPEKKDLFSYIVNAMVADDERSQALDLLPDT